MTRALLLSLPLSLGAIEVPIEFVVGGNSRADVTYKIGPTLNNAATYQGSVSYSGTLLAEAELHPISGELSSIRFTGGSLRTSDIQQVLTLLVGQVSFTVNLQISGITRSTLSAEPQEMEDSFLNGNLHETVLSGGSIEVSNFQTLNPGAGTATEILSAATPANDLIGDDLLFPTTTGSAQVSVSRESSDLWGANYSASLWSVLALSTQSPPAEIQAAGLAANQKFQQSYREVGNVYAEASFSAPSAFAVWAEAANLDLTTGEEKNASGYPYALLFALGLEAGTSHLPLTTIREEGGKPILLLTLPESGLGFALSVQYSPDLASAFTPLGSEYLLDGSKSLNRGKSGPVRIAFPDGPRGFLRFVVEL
ncbi:hypothetical protein [Roseibacillus ishigakijimensis]|uniref:Uncharacterized protein n=1 Tax=Roseibacillus ishigakijimensis TaxID=454146 RepID=A0A934VLZ7_9BACT|nr:hypothetical protein [Roseibacillus ishigakijimensis]MBK1835204.1 hypothetical protein [Roseibacillus ishigakijimensis]